MDYHVFSDTDFSPVLVSNFLSDVDWKPKKINQQRYVEFKKKTKPVPAVLPQFLKNKITDLEKFLFTDRKNGRHLVVGQTPNKKSLVLQSNDYLAVSSFGSILEAQIRALQQQKQTALMSAVFLHEDSQHCVFEQKMADYVGYERAILSQSGWAANVGLLQVIADANTPIYIDFLAHTSLWEGIKSAGATAHPFRHNDIEHLEKQIQKHGAGIILIDSVYSTVGTVAPLVEIAHLSSRYGCVLVVDESHSLGTHGPHGAGLVAELGIRDQVHFITASLAKAFAGRAGIVFCANAVARCFPYISHPAIFSSTLLPYEIAGLSATLDLIKQADYRRKMLFNKAGYLRKKLRALGYAVESQSQIVSLEPGLESTTEIFRDALEARDVFGSVFCAPATPKNRALMRFSVNSGLTYQQLDYIIGVCRDIREEVGLDQWRSTKKKNKGSHF